MRRARGFTLGELLISVAIVVVIAALLLSWVGNARESARRAVCLSNLHQLNLSYQTYVGANGNKGLVTVASGGQLWTKALVPYSTKGDNENQILKELYCPSAATVSNGVGTADKAWGPHFNFVDAAKNYSVNVGKQSSSYGFNGRLFSNNLNAALYCGGIDTKGDPGTLTIHGDVVCVATDSVKGFMGVETVKGTIFTGKTLTETGAATNKTVIKTGMTLPPVDKMYAALDQPGIPNLTTAAPSTIDFSSSPVIKITAKDVNLYGTTFIGGGTLLVNGNIKDLPDTNPTLNIVCNGDITWKVNGHATNINGSIYTMGKFYRHGGGTVTGIIVCWDNFQQHYEGVTVLGGAPPSFDIWSWQTYGPTMRVMLDANPNIPTFADAIWPEAWVSSADKVPTNTQLGDSTTGLGRFYINRHSHAIDVAFMDGRAETVKLKNLPGLKW
jgi:type II secretory pathway pseudopilin PulG